MMKIFRITHFGKTLAIEIKKLSLVFGSKITLIQTIPICVITTAQVKALLKTSQAIFVICGI